MKEAFRAKATIDQPRAKVWAALTDWDRAPKWMAGVEAVRANGDTVVGTELRFTARGDERRSRVEACKPEALLVLRSVQGGVTADYRYELRERGAATELTLVASCEARGAWVLIAPLVRHMMKRVDGEQLAALKVMVEGA